MARGGIRPGAGRKKGSTVRPQLRDYYTPAELKKFMDTLKKQALIDPTIMKFVAEQLMGKAVQPIGNDDERAFMISFDKAFNGATR